MARLKIIIVLRYFFNYLYIFYFCFLFKILANYLIGYVNIFKI